MMHIMQAKLPNIVFIFADDLGYGDFGCYGATKIPTPNVDRLAQQGMRFFDTHSSSAVCTPSRYSLLTGRYCWRTWLKRWVIGGLGYPVIESERPTIADILRKHGYRTGMIGKWHLGFEWPSRKSTSPIMKILKSYKANNVDYKQPLKAGPLDHGFDYFFGISGSLDMFPYCFIENRHTIGIPDRPKTILHNQQRPGPMVEGWRDEEVDITFTQKAKEFIRSHHENQPDQPFFLYLPTASPHRPCDCRPEFVIGKSKAGDRGDMVVLFDWIVGQIMDELDRLGVAENTLFIVSSDNGAQAVCANGQDYGHRSNGVLRGQKADIWDGGHREPMIIRWPNHIAPGTINRELIGLQDWFATLANIVGEPMKEDMGEDSISFAHIFDGSALPQANTKLQTQITAEPQKRESIIHHSGWGMYSIRKGYWKLILGLGSGGFTYPSIQLKWFWRPKGQLYDLETDPQEQTNLWKKEPKIVVELQKLLKTCIRSRRTRPI
jgi:arylsulfatase A-like enzyme